MNRHERRAMDKMTRMQGGFLAQLPQESDAVKRQKTEFFQWLAELKRRNEKPLIAYGALAEREGANAFIQKTVYPESGGCEQHLWGISYPLKMNRQGYNLLGFELAKSLVSELPRELIGSSTLLSGAFGLYFLFDKKKAMMFLDRFLYSILYRSIKHTWIPLEQYNPAPKEIRRACMAVLERRGFRTDYQIGSKGPNDFTVPPPDGTIEHIWYCLSVFMGFFFEVDLAYRFRVQDAFQKDLWTMLDTLIAREAKTGVGHKWKWIKRVMKLFLWRYPELSSFVEEALNEIDLEKVKLDEADWYFVLGYISYDFGGISADERWRIRKLADEQKGHIIFYG